MRITFVAGGLSVLVCALRLTLGDHEQAEAHVGFFYSQMLSADFSGAQKNIDEAVRLWPGNSRYYAWRAYCTSQSLPSQCSRCAATMLLDPATKRIIEQSIGDYRKSLALNSRDAVVHHNLAWLNHLIANDAMAKEAWERAVALDPNNAEYHLSLGMFLEEQGDAIGMMDQYMKAIQLSPGIVDSPFFRDFRARSPQASSRIVNETTERLEAAVRKTGDPILKARLGKLYLFSQNTERASALLLQASADLPNLPLVWFNLGEVRCTQGRCDEAQPYYRKALALDGRLPGPLVRIGQANLRAGQPKIALGYFRSAAHDWERMTPITAARNQRLYRGVPQTIDELLPTTLVWYTSPCVASTAYRALAQLSPRETRYRQRANTCEEIPAPHSCPR
jgi:tetratricopeptide (TPR) repeat protein